MNIYWRSVALNYLQYNCQQNHKNIVGLVEILNTIIFVHIVCNTNIKKAIEVSKDAIESELKYFKRMDFIETCILLQRLYSNGGYCYRNRH